MPCVLPLEKTDSNLVSEHLKDAQVAGPLFVSFAEDCSPQGLFCAVVTCVSKMSTFSVGTTLRLDLLKRRNLIEFVIQEQNSIEDISSSTTRSPSGTMLLWDKMTHFEIFCTGCDQGKLSQIRVAVTTAIFNACQVMHYNIDHLGFSIGLQCTSSCGIRKRHGTNITWHDGHWTARCVKNVRQHPRPLEESETLWFPSSSSTEDDIRPPKLLQLMDEVGSNTNKWKAIAIYLELTMTEIDRISMESSHSVEDCFREVFKKWEKSAKMPFSWRTIVDALKTPSVGEQRLADTISKKYL